MEIVPEDFASLKRPALQKLCKKFGIKANGKVRIYMTFFVKRKGIDNFLEGYTDFTNLLYICCTEC